MNWLLRTLNSAKGPVLLVLTTILGVAVQDASVAVDSTIKAVEAVAAALTAVGIIKKGAAEKRKDGGR